MANPNDKDTIYIDIDDEITSVIEKVRNSDKKIVALVLPKRATVLQSIVNMKLLKRTADAAKKHIVLITAEAGLFPMAGTVGLHVAKTLQSKPEIPSVAGEDDTDEIADESLEDEEPADNAAAFTAQTAGDRSVGDLASAAAVAADADKEEPIETLSMDDDDSDSGDADNAPAAAAKKSAKKKNKKLAVPNFNKFRLLLIAGVLLLVILIVGGYLAAVVLPKATVTITTDTSDIASSLTLNIDTAAKTLNATSLTVPAQSKQIQKSQTQQVATTGKKNTGTAASGNVTMSAGSCSANVPLDVPSGSGLTSGGLTYITQESVSFNPTVHGGKCTYQGIGGTSGATSISIAAQNGGANYNVSGASFTVVGRSDVSASGSTSGGTDNIIQIVTQADIDSATQKLAAQNTAAIQSQLEQQFQQAGLFVLPSTFNAGTPASTTSSNVGDQSSTVTVTQVTTYTMFGVKQNDLKTLVDNNVKGQINPSKQVILSEGLDKASFHVNSASATSAQIAMTTNAVAGPDLQAATIKTQIAGKKSGDIQSLLKSDPGVSAVKVHFSPFWVNSVPSKASKVTITFQKATN